ncbi:transposase [Cucumis melo var. makuwa]|uniref:Transposase n=1 Tax=Cucumis melo var. makuwa TaxID=1194695 RepID=A0A5A7UIG5_CUCMM|nr:transposase [Cucumis melo var. makuwa]
MFKNVENAKNLRWHAMDRKIDGIMRHPADTPSWRLIDHMWPTFGSEPRNLRLGPKQPGYDINTYLAPLIDDLKILWEEGVWCFDAYKEEYFPAYGKQEHGKPPQPLSGEAIYFKLKEMIFSSGKKCGKNNNEDGNDYWKRKSEFFELPYWKNLHVRHCLDVMHIEKNVCMNIVGTLLDLPDKSKDGMNSRLDLVEMNIRPELAPIVTDNRTYIPAACYTLSREEKYWFYKTLAEIKVPEGYSSNNRSLVSLNDLKLNGLKSHDCHVLMQQLLPIAIRSILPKNVRYTISRLCFFFNAICAKSFSVSELDALQEDIVMTLCNLEKYFPPSFFTIMVHLVVHLVREVKLCGSVYLRWMYPFERYMKVLKSFVRNRNRPEGCIAEAQVCEEAVHFCSDFLYGLDEIGLGSLNSREEKQTDRPLSAGTYVRPDMQKLKQAHLHILQNTEEVHPYIEEHMNHLKIENPRRAKNEQWLQVEHNRSFGAWIRDKVMCELHEGKLVSNTIRWLAHGPNCGVMTYEGYMVNGCSYHTKSRDDHRTVQNSGIMLVATTMQVSSAKDKNPMIGDMSFYGIIEDIWEVCYNTFNIVLFKCKWVENKNGVRIDDLHFTLVDLSRIGHSSDSFIIATHGQQVFYVSDPVDPRWSIVSQNGIQLVTLMKVGMHTLDLTVKAHGLPLDFHTIKRQLEDVAPPKEKGESSTQKRKRGLTEMKEITRARRTTVQFHVPIIYFDWPTVPKEIKDKIFEPIEAGFVVDPRSKKTIIQNAGVCFRQFKYRLTTTYVLPFLDDVEKLKFSRNEYSFIDQQHWTEFVASRLKEDFKKKSENGKEKRKKRKYNHITSRKGYANLMEELDELVATQNTTNAFGEEDILTRALGGKDRPGILRSVGKYVTKKKYFHTATQQKTNEKEDDKATSKEHDRMVKRIKELEEELLKMKENDDCVGNSKEEQGMGSKEKSFIEGAENVNDLEDLSNDLESEKDVEDVVEFNEDIKVNIAKDDKKVEGVTLEKMKLAFEMKDHVVAWGTIIDSDVEGDNVKVAVNVVVDGDCAIPIPSEQEMYKMSQEMDYGEFTKDMSTFAPTPIQNAPVALRFILRMVEHMGSAIQITTPHDVFGVRRKCCIMIESLKDFTSMRPIATACLDAYIMYLYTRMESSRTLNLYKFVDVGSISCRSSKEERAQLLTARLLGTDYDQLLLIPYNFENHWTLVVINLMKGAAFWIDPLKNRIDPDVTEVVERVVKCPKQSGVVECGYYVMRFMRDIIMSTSTSIIQIMKDSPRAYTQDDIDCIRSEWAEFVGKHIKKCAVDLEVYKEVLLILKCVVDVEVDKGLNKAKGNSMAFYKCVVHHEVNVMCLCG